jgi:peptide-methionine (S)-S-oxide reductase
MTVRRALLVAAVLWAGAAQAETATAIFAGGCFWCMEEPFDVLPGVISTTSGYIGGHAENPSYKQVSSGSTGHTEAVQVVYDPDQIGYAALLDTFWRNIDPTVKDRQFCDTGSQYRSSIFGATPEERKLTQASRDRVGVRLGVPIHTEITDAGPFYAAEDYHQDYYRKNPIRYGFYRRGCGRDARLAEIWGADAPRH